MRVGVSIPVEERLPATRLVELAQIAERGGFDTVVAGEVQGPEAMALLGAVAASTERITIGSGVVPMATRGAALTAMGFATLASLAPGRVFAGVGVSSPLVVEQWHGRTFEAPLPYVRRFLPELRRALDGERLDSGFRLALDVEHRVPIVLAAMRPRMIELAGELADGVFLTWCPPDEAPDRVALARRGAERAGRNPDDLLVLVSYFAYAGPESDASLERMRRYLVQYAVVPTHRDSFRGTLAHLDEIGAAWSRGDRKRALELVSDDEVQRISVVGTAEHVLRRAKEFHAAGVDLPIVLATAARAGDDVGPFATVEGVGRLLAGTSG
jgi:alkanesulfonate monooxygenase SsuD/methylene tetrahydromethanopterin reductase-like flavin-dependent oxidoreductase (luciferase family)